MPGLRIGGAVRRARIGLANFLHSRRRLPRYVVLGLSGSIDELPQPRPQLPFPIPFAHLLLPLLPPEPPSVVSLRFALDRLAQDPRIVGVVLRIECAASAATYQSLRKLLLDFRAKGKRLVACANSFGPFQYYLACVCDQIVMPPGAEWSVVGLLREYYFFHDAFEQLGVGVDVINVSPYKSAFDQFVRNDFSDESRAQAEWLLDANFAELVRGMAEGRKLSEAQVRELVNAAPLGVEEARERGLIDAVLYEDQLEHYLVPPATSPTAAPSVVPAATPETAQAKEPAATATTVTATEPKEAGKRGKRNRLKAQEPFRELGLYDDVRRWLAIPYREYGPKFIAVVSVEGTIVEGHSQNVPSPIPLPLFGNRYAGSESVAQALRRAGESDRIAAVILHVDSSGGLVLASDLIAHEVRRLRAKKPVVAYMGGVAASGGYYVAALANCIVAQPLTITGSIGVITMKPNLQKTDEKLYLHRVQLQRGERAGLFSTARPLNGEERAAISSSVQRAYDDFKRIVSEGRGMSVETVEAIAGGRVWTGEMAKERKLVDELGDFTVAVDKAKELAGLPKDQRVIAFTVQPPRRFTLPAPATALGWISKAAQTQSLAHSLAQFLSRARTWAILPWSVEREN